MPLSLPSASLTVRKSGLGLVTGGPTNVHVAIGPASKGPMKTPLAFTVSTDAAETFGCGPMPKAAAYATRAVRTRYIAIRIPAVAVAASVSSVTKPTGKTVTVTGTALWGFDVVFVFTVGGTVGSAGMFYKYSLDGGLTYTTPAALGTATTVLLTGTGLTVNLTATQTFTALDEIRFWSKPASQAIQTTTVTRFDASTSTIEFDGTPNDDYELSFEVLTGCTIGVTGGTFRYSLDGGRNWSVETQIGVATSLTLLDGIEDSGVTIELGAGTLEAGDGAVAETTGPAWQASDVQEAIDALFASTHVWRFIHVAGDTTAAKVASVGGMFDTLAGQGAYTYGMFSARDRVTGELDADGKPSVSWRERLITEFADIESERVSVSAGRARVTCPITGRSNRRPASWIACARLIEKTIQIDPGRKLDGALPSDVLISDANGSLVELDSRIADTLHGARFLTLRTYLRKPGVYVTRGNAMAPEASEFNRISLRAVMDLASEIFQDVMTEQLENNLLANPLTGPQPGETGDEEDVTPGALAEADARVIDREFLTALKDVLVKRGYVSGVSARVSREDPFLTTGELTAEVSLTPLGYVDKFTGGIAYENPRLAAQSV